MITEREFDKLIKGPIPGVGWGVYKHVCPYCHRNLVIVAMVFTMGFTCVCGFEEDITFSVASPIRHDGAWLHPVGWQRARLSKN